MSLNPKNTVKKARITAERKEFPRAHLHALRVAPRKMKILADMIRGRKVEEAMALLSFTPKSGAKILQKLLMSAVFNAENQNHEGADLFVKTVFVDYGPIMKWRRPRARGRAFRINKHTSHVTVIVSSQSGK